MVATDIDPVAVACARANGVRALEGVEHVIVVDGGDDVEQHAPEGFDFEAAWRAVEPDDVLTLIYTSGTTGRPKGVVYSHRAIVLHSLVSGLACAMGPTDRDTVLILVPMFHANAWGLPYTCTFVGSKQVLPGAHLDTAQLAEILTNERVTQCSAVPTVWLNLLEYMDRHPGVCDLSHMRVLGTGGQAMPEDAVRRFHDEFGITMVSGWGMTETSSGVCSNTLLQHRFLTVGKPFPGVEIKIAADGEILVKGAGNMVGYHNKPEATAEMVRDGWIHTGDIGELDPDGFLKVTDRKKSLFKTAGAK